MTRKKRVKFLGIDVDVQEVALLVKYEVEVVATVDGVSETESKQASQTKIRVKTLSESSNVEKLAQQIAAKCKLIPESKVPVVVNKLYELQFQVTGGGGAAPAPGPAPAPAPAPDYGAQDAEREAEEREREERERQYRQQMAAQEEEERRRRDEQELAERRRREDEERERQQQREMMERERLEEQQRDEERQRATERERAAYNGFDDANGWSQPVKGDGRYGQDESSPDGGVSSGWGDDDGDVRGNAEEERARRAAEDAERERERQRRAAERERKEREWEEQEARRQKEKEESEAERLKQRERQREWAAQRSEAIALQKEDEIERQKEQNQMEKIRKQMDKVSFDKLDEYIEKLYDDDSKVKGTHKILLLARNPDHLEDLLMNETLMGVLSRLFREDARKSMDLAINIAYIFYSFSVYSKFHATISQHRVGALTFRTIEVESERSMQLGQDMEQLDAHLKTLQPGSRDDEVAQKKVKKLRSITRKQDKLLTVSFHILLNLAEDTKVEKKMVSKKMKLIPHLISLLQRRNLELRQLAVMFLKKLSIFRENVVEMGRLDIIGKLSSLIPNDHQPLLVAVLRLLLNLSFDSSLRTKMALMDYAPKITESFNRSRGPRGDGAASELALTMLYQLSTDQGTRHKFRHTECIPLVVGMLSQGGGGADRTAVALAINLSLAPGNAEQLAAKGQLRQLVRTASQTMDNCLLKLIRNLSAHDLPYREEFRAYVDELLAMSIRCDNHDVLVEVLGIVSNMNLSCCDLEGLVHKYDLANWLKKFLVPGFVHDDIVLEVIMVIGVISTEPRCSSILANSGLVDGLAQLMEYQKGDDEMVLQLCYTFYCLVRQTDTREVILVRVLLATCPCSTMSLLAARCVLAGKLIRLF